LGEDGGDADVYVSFAFLVKSIGQCTDA
jgi:hypothetical protein